MRNVVPYEPCPMTCRDCAALGENGLCLALTKIDYRPNKPCPFYKSAARNAEEIAQTCYRLARLGRYDLILKCI